MKLGSVLSSKDARQKSQLLPLASLSISHVFRELLSLGFFLSTQGEQTIPLTLWVTVMFIRLMSSVLVSVLTLGPLPGSCLSLPLTCGVELNYFE